MNRLRICVILSVAWGHILGSAGPAQALTTELRVALLIAHNNAGRRAKALRYAVSDAHKFKKVLQQVAGYQKQHIFLALNRSASQVQRIFRQVKAHIAAQRKQHPSRKIVLLVYYSGHARNGQFFLGDSSLSFGALRRFLKTSGSSLRLALLDTCGSGRFLETRGIKRHKKGFRIPFLNAHSTKGEAIITSTGDRENAYEDLKLRGGIFTHYVSTGLRGAADRNHDGRVTLNELYTFVYHRTINRTVFAHAGPQEPHFQTNIRGTGQVILSKIHNRLARIHFHRQLKGQFFVWDQKGTLYAGFRKEPQKAIQLAMRPGEYQIQWRHGKRVFSSRVKLRRDQVYFLNKKQGKLAYFRYMARRGGEAPVLSQYSWVHGEDITPYTSLRWSGGINSAMIMGGTIAGGGSFGVEGRYYSLQLGAWGFALDFADDQRQTISSQQLLLHAQVAGGYRFQWEHFSLFTGLYLGLGFAAQHLNTQPRVGLLFLTGAQITPTYWFSSHWGLVLPLQLGVELGQRADALQARLTYAITAGFAFRF